MLGTYLLNEEVSKMITLKDFLKAMQHNCNVAQIIQSSGMRDSLIIANFDEAKQEIVYIPISKLMQ